MHIDSSNSTQIVCPDRAYRKLSSPEREPGISQPSTSRLIAALEKSIGAALITRTTRIVLLTDARADFLARVEPILAALEDTNPSARGTGDLP